MTGSLVIDRRAVTPTATRADLAAGLRVSLETGTGFAVGKLGLSEQALLAYPFLIERCRDPRQAAALTAQTRQHSDVNLGIFPVDRDGMLEFAQSHATATRALDLVGLVGGRLESDLIADLSIAAPTIDLHEMEPDRSIPDDSARCYLPLLSGRRVLIVSSIATILAARANKDTFEAVWSKTGKRWFEPAEVSALEFPYTYDVETRRRFGTSQNLLAWIIERIDPRTFDVALIAGASLGIPLAAEIKAMNRPAVALGGALQVLFGVGGKRWWQDPVWQRDHITEAWVDVPRSHVPRVASAYVDDGAYW